MDHLSSARFSTANCLVQSREQFPKVRQPGRTRTQHDDRDVERLDVLLVRQFFVHGYEDIEFRGR